MKTLLKKSVSSIHSFTIKELSDPYFDPNWHFHPEYQLFCVLEGRGTRFIGDHIKPFMPGDIVFLGPNVPHLWRSDEQYFRKDSQLAVQGIVVYFKEDFLGRGFFEHQEMAMIKHLFEKSVRGLDITGQTRRIMVQKMGELVAKEGFESVISLLEILHILSISNDYQYISSLGFTNNFKQSEAERMHIVHEYVMENFRQEISLATVAGLANMSSSAFCRYFKARANKTFSDFVNEIRIGHACRLLIEDKMSVTQIAYECGFKNISNFNRQFKHIVKESPLKYQRHYTHLPKV